MIEDRDIWCNCVGGALLFDPDQFQCANCLRPVKPDNVSLCAPVTEEEERQAWRSPKGGDVAFEGGRPVPTARAQTEPGEVGEEARALIAFLEDVFEDGPHPAHSSRRLVSHLGVGDSWRQPFWASATNEAALARLWQLDIDPHQCAAALRASAQATGAHMRERYTPLKDLTKDVPETALRAAISIVAGSRVKTVLMRCYCLAFQLRRELIANMILTDIAGAFCVKRRTPSAILTRLTVSKSGLIVAGQKGAGHRAAAKKAARGNKNRATGSLRRSPEFC